MIYKSRAVMVAVSLLLITGLLLVAPVRAQNSLAPDSADLAKRLLGFDGQPRIPDLSPIYNVGDTTQFWTSKAGHDTPVETTAKLAARGQDIYIWVEEGVDYTPLAARQLAGQLGQLLAIMRIVSNYPQADVIPQSGRDLGVIPTYNLPDVDNDPYLYVVFTRDLMRGQNLIHNPVNSLMAELVPGGYSNQHEMIFVNTSNLPGVALNHNAYVGLLARGLYNLLAAYNNPGQAAWLSQAVAWYMLLYNSEEPITAGDVEASFAAPEIPLLGTTGQEFGQQQLFLHYLDQRFGANVLARLATGSGPGLVALDEALRVSQITDPVSGEPVTGVSVFADFVMANILNGAFGDGRYVHVIPAARGLNARFSSGQDQFNFDLSDQVINQFGTRYLVLQATRDTDFVLFFTGEDTVARLPMPEGDEGNHFYWSGDMPNRDAKMTRTVDLSGVRSATLTFDAWYSLQEGRHYAYVQVSTDGGATWEILPATDTVTTNPYALNYGVGFTGVSSAEAIRPFPYLGATFDTNGMSIMEIAEGGPAASTDLQVGDVVVGYDGEPWEGQPDIIGLLNEYEPGETVNLLIERDGDTFDLPIRLGAHPTRIRVPDAVWLPQTVDLSAYAGQSIQLRFESVSFPGQHDLGMVIDNIAIPEINFLDDAESGVPGWTLEGWQQTTNQLDQRFLIQSALLTEDNVHVRPLIGAGDRATEGAWEFSLDAGEALILAISGVNDNTTLPARYSLSARTQGNNS